MASLNGFEEIVKVLLEYGADPLVKTQVRILIPLHMFYRHVNQEVLS